ncbi:hypothetical protein GGF42_001769 [Coemansia sp. RSA 2424]|nr:hypothetical protein GGF42_001769 [Coemansia sp. RSA 2424]
MLIEMARRGVYARQTIVPLRPSETEPVRLHRRQGTSSSDDTLVEAAGMDFTPPQHTPIPSNDHWSDFDNAPPEATQLQTKGACFGLPYAQRYNPRNWSENMARELPQASMHIAPATVSYKAAPCSPTRRAGRIQLSLPQAPKLGRVAINASNRPSAELPAAVGEDAVRRYSQQQPERHKAALESKPRQTQGQVPSTASPAANQHKPLREFGRLQDRSSIGSTGSAEHSSSVHAVLRTVGLQQHRPQLVSIVRLDGGYQLLPLLQ